MFCLRAGGKLKTIMLKPLEPPDSLHLRAAEGWIGLGDLASAREELDQIAPAHQGHLAVLFVRCQLSFKAEKWEEAAEISKNLTRSLPDGAAGWILFAYSMRRKAGGGIPQAKEILMGAERKFPRDYLFPFNLACYCSQLSQFDEARGWLDKALAIDKKTVQTLAASDPDLKPLWESIGGLPWKGR